MARLSDVDAVEKADWYRGQRLMTGYGSYEEFLVYLNNPIISNYRGGYVQTKAEQTQKANEAWEKVAEELTHHQHLVWWDNLVPDEYFYDKVSQRTKLQRERVHLPWWNPYENREWTLEEVSQRPREFQEGGESYYNYEPPNVRLERLVFIPHKVTGQPTKKGHRQYAYRNPVTGDIEWLGDYYERGYNDRSGIKSFYIADVGSTHPNRGLNRSPTYDKMEMMQPIMVYSGITPEAYHDNAPALSDESSETMRVRAHENAVQQYDLLLENSMAGLTSQMVKKVENETKADAKGRWPVWNKTKYTGTGPASHIYGLFDVIKAIRYAQQFPKIKALTVGARGQAKLLRTVLVEPPPSPYSYRRDIAADNKHKEWERQTIINLYDFGSHLSDLEALSKKAMISEAGADMKGKLKELNKEIRKKKATIKKNQDPAHLAKEVAKRMKTLEETVKQELKWATERVEEELRRLENNKGQTQATQKAITDGGQEDFRHHHGGGYRRDRAKIR
jgi:hypothetical protein